MKYISDPITDKLSKFIWLFWAVLWVSLAIGFGSETNFVMVNAKNGYEIPGLIASILLWGAVFIQIVKLIYYSHECNYLLRIGRWLLLIATGIFAYRMTYMLIVYGDIYASLATIVGAIVLAMGLILASLGAMMTDHFKLAT